MTAISEKKIKRTPRRRITIFMVVCLLVLVLPAAIRLIKQRREQFVTYQYAVQRATPLEKVYSPDGTSYFAAGYGQCCFSNVWLINNSAGIAYHIDNSGVVYHAVYWSADSRYVALSESNPYGSRNLALFDMVRGHFIPTPGFDRCGGLLTSPCRAEEVVGVAPITPRILITDHTVLNMPDGTWHRIDINGLGVQALWTSTESRLFILTYRLNNDPGAELAGYFADSDGLSPVQALLIPFWPDKAWNQNLYVHMPEPCRWNTDETGVICEFNGQVYSVEDTRP